jgi:hypothetical protein
MLAAHNQQEAESVEAGEKKPNTTTREASGE